MVAIMVSNSTVMPLVPCLAMLIHVPEVRLRFHQRSGVLPGHDRLHMHCWCGMNR